MKKNYRNPMTRPENFMNPAGNVMKEIKEADLNNFPQVLVNQEFPMALSSVHQQKNVTGEQLCLFAVSLWEWYETTGMMTTEWIGLASMHRYHMQIQNFLRNGGDYYG